MRIHLFTLVLLLAAQVVFAQQVTERRMDHVRGGIDLGNLMCPHEIEERRQDIGKTEPAFSHAAIVFRIIPLEPDMGSVRQ